MSQFKEREVTGVNRQSTLVPTGVSVSHVPVRELRDADRSREPVSPVHVRSAHQMLGFSQHVAKNLKREKEFGLLADPGLGKSTVFPLMLAKTTKVLVVLIEFCGSLAEGTFEGLVRVRDGSEEYKGVGLTLYSDHKTPLIINEVSVPHVVVISTRKILGRAALGFEFPPVIAVHDESHYSDYASYTWRNVTAQFDWVVTNIALSATLSPDKVVQRTAIDGVKRERREVVMVVPPVGEWIARGVPGDATAPWAVAALSGKRTLIFSDDHAANATYGARLADNGVQVFHLKVGASAGSVRAARAVTQSTVGSVVIFADAPFRNGYNFKLDVVIDCGLVREEFLADGKVWERYRLANVTEIVQGAARVGRLQDGVVYRNRADYPSHVPILALGEVRHAAALMILLGFRPSQVLVELAPEVAAWGHAEARVNVQRTLDQLSRASLSERVPAPMVTAASRVSVERGSDGHDRSSQGFDLEQILEKAQSLHIEDVPVEKAFASNHPGVRYEVPNGYFRVPSPYWVSPDGAERMMRLLLSGVDKYDVGMLTLEEVQWFASRLVARWNELADDVVANSIALAAAFEVSRSNTFYQHASEAIRRTQEATALGVRHMEGVIDLLRRFYTVKPFTVRCVSHVNDSGLSHRRAIAEIDALASTVGRTGTQSSVGTSSSGSSREKPKPVTFEPSFTWRSSTVVPRAIKHVTGSTSGSGSTTSGDRRA